MASYSEYLAQKKRNQLVFLDTRPRWTAAQFTEVTRNNANIVLDRRPNGVPGFDATAIPSFFAANAYRTGTASQDKPSRYVPNAPVAPPVPRSGDWNRTVYAAVPGSDPVLWNPSSWGTLHPNPSSIPEYTQRGTNDGDIIARKNATLLPQYANIVVHLTGYFLPPVTGTYTFNYITDDGFQMKIGNVMAIDGRTNYTLLQSQTIGSSFPVYLQADTFYPIEALLGNGGGAFRLTLTGITFNNGTPMPGTIFETLYKTLSAGELLKLYDPVRNAISGDWSREYYRWIQGTELSLTISDRASWGYSYTAGATLTQFDKGGIRLVNGGGGGGISNPYSLVAIYFTGYFVPPVSGTYVFNVKSDDGFQMILNGTTILDSRTINGGNMSLSVSSLDSSPISLVAGVYYPVQALYANGVFGFFLELSATYNSGNALPIPFLDTLYH